MLLLKLNTVCEFIESRLMFLELQSVLAYWNLSFWQRFREGFKPNSVYKFRNKVLQVVQAPEPSDVEWENAGVAKEKKFILRVFTNLICLGLLALTFAAVFKVNDIKVLSNDLTCNNNKKVSLLSDLQKREKEPDSSKWLLMFEIEAVTMAASLIVVVVNFYLKMIMKKLVKYRLL